MSSAIREEPLKVWIPSDNDLASLGRQRIGWCTRGRNAERCGRLTQKELDAIKHVIFRAEMIERAEQIRISLLKLQYDRMLSDIKGNGATSCIVCARDLEKRVTSPTTCLDCRKSVCSSCTSLYEESSGNRVVLCRLCFNKRELWKKSGAWFTNALPEVQVLSKSKQQWLTGHLQQRPLEQQQQQQLPRQPLQPSLVEQKQELKPLNPPSPSSRCSSQQSLNIFTHGVPVTVTMDTSSLKRFSGGEMGRVKWLAEPYNPSAAVGRESPVSLADTKSMDPATRKLPAEVTTVNPIEGGAPAGDRAQSLESEDENNFSFDVYMSVGNVHSS